MQKRGCFTLCLLGAVCLFIILDNIFSLSSPSKNTAYSNPPMSVSSSSPTRTPAPKNTPRPTKTPLVDAWGEDQTTSEITGPLSVTAFWTENGKSYHFSLQCPSLSRSKHILQGTLQEALSAGKTDPCNNCANG